MVRKLILLIFCVLGMQISFGQPIGNQIEQQYVSFDKGFIWDMNSIGFKFLLYPKTESVYFEYEHVSSDFGPRRLKNYDFHGGIDFSRGWLSFGDAIVAIEEGVVKKIESNSRGIKSIIVDCDGYGYGYRHMFTGLESGYEELPMRKGNFIMGHNSSVGHFIINIITDTAFCDRSNVSIISYNNKDYPATNVIKKGQLIGPIGNSGNNGTGNLYNTHLHLEFLEDPNAGFDDKNALNPLHYLEYSIDFYSDYVVLDKSKRRKKLTFSGDDKINSIYDVLVESSSGGSTYDNCVLDINNVAMEIVSVEDLNFQTAVGTSNELMVSYGGLPRDSIYPSYVRKTIGGESTIGVYPYAYKDNEGNQAFDRFFFPGFVPGISLKDTYNNKGTTMARYIGEARYPDGDYFLRGKMITVKDFNKTSENYPINIDNFNPYLVYCDVHYDGLGNHRKELKEVCDKLVYEETGGYSFYTNNGTFDIEVRTSESVGSLSVIIEDITGQVYLSHENTEKTLWRIDNISFSGTMITDKIMTFFAKDMNGNDLIIHPDASGFEGHLVQGKFEKILSNIKRKILGKDKSTGYDANHSIRFSDSGEPDIIFNDFNVRDGDGQGSGNGNGQVEIGEYIDLEVALENIGDATAHNVTAILSTSTSYVYIEDSYEEWENINSGSLKWCNADFDFTVQEGFTGNEVGFMLNITSDEGTWIQTFSVPVVGSGIGLILELDDLEIHDGIGGGSGNENGLVNSGEEIDLDIKVRNSGDEIAIDVRATLYTNDSYITITDNIEYFGDIQPGESIWCNSDFDFTVDFDCPEKDVAFWVYLIADNYSRRVDFSIHVYGGVPNLNVDAVFVHDGDGQGGEGNGNNIAEAGEEIDLEVRLENLGNGIATNISAHLSVDNSDIDITDDYETWEDIHPGEDIWCNSDFDFTVSDDFQDCDVEFTLEIEADSYTKTEYFSIFIVGHRPDLDVYEIYIRDGDGQGSGNGNNIAEAGEEIDLEVRLKNYGEITAENIFAYLSCFSDDIDVTDDYEVWDDIDPNYKRWCNSDYDFTIDNNIGDGNVYFELDINADDYDETRYFYIYVYGDKSNKTKGTSNVIFVSKDELLYSYKPFVSPNPITNQSKLDFFSEKETFISVDLYNINGVLFQHVFYGKVESGINSILLNIGEDVSSGVYILKIESEGKCESIRTVILKN